MKNLLMIIFVLVFSITTSFTQIIWEKHPSNPIFSDTTGGWTTPGAYCPCILIIDGTYHMWYTGNDGTYGRIGYATSLDGLTWVPYANNPVLDVGLPGSYEASSVCEPNVIYDGSMFHMWYGGINKNTSPWTEAIGYATSPDCITWAKYSNQPVLEKDLPGRWDDTKVFTGSVIYDGSIYHMWYSGGSTGSIRHTGYATSTDGANWTRYANNPVLTAGSSNFWDYPRTAQAKVVYGGSKYHMFYSGNDWFQWRIGYATAPNETSWTKYEDYPVLNIGNPQEWDDYYVGVPAVVIDSANSIFRMWYTGGIQAGDAHIGYATAPFTLPDTILVPGDFPTIQAAIDFASDSNIVLVADGTYFENINFKGKSITVASQFIMDGDTSHISNTIIDGSQPSNPDSGSVVYFISGEDTTSILCGFTIAGGSGTYSIAWDMYFGGGIHMQAGGKVLHNKITGNHMVSQKGCWGAGMVASSLNMSANILIEHNEFIDNSIVSPLQSGGGGIHIPLRWWTGGYCRVKENFISNNSVTVTGTYKALAGGIMLSFNLPTTGEVIIENNIISHNDLHCIASVGAGIYVAYFDPGYAIVDENPTPLICNNIIKNNYSESMGGGLAIWTVENGHISGSLISPQPAIINNTIVNNSAEDGCGIFSFDSYPLLLNNILWNDLSISGSKEIFDTNINFPPYVPPYHDPYNNGDVFARYTDIQDTLWPCIGNINADPLFSDTLYHLGTGSPCINAGDPAPLCNDYDGTRNDMGIYGGIPDSLIKYINIITKIEDKIEILQKFTLKQNYPNPFNPTTTIEFSIPKSEFVTLKIYNLLGQEVEELVAKRLTPGNYNYSWDASGLASGIYFYKIEASNFQKVKKLILLR